MTLPHQNALGEFSDHIKRGLNPLNAASGFIASQFADEVADRLDPNDKFGKEVHEGLSGGLANQVMDAANASQSGTGYDNIVKGGAKSFTKGAAAGITGAVTQEGTDALLKKMGVSKETRDAVAATAGGAAQGVVQSDYVLNKGAQAATKAAKGTKQVIQSLANKAKAQQPGGDVEMQNVTKDNAPETTADTTVAEDQTATAAETAAEQAEMEEDIETTTALAEEGPAGAIAGITLNAAFAVTNEIAGKNKTVQKGRSMANNKIADAVESTVGAVEDIASTTAHAIGNFGHSIGHLFGF